VNGWVRDDVTLSIVSEECWGMSLRICEGLSHKCVGYLEQIHGNCLGIPVSIVPEKEQLVFADTVRIVRVCKDFWGILGVTESISGNYCVAKMSGKMRSAEVLLEFEVWDLLEFYTAFNPSFLATFLGNLSVPSAEVMDLEL
jgi:hypothetical protein